MEIVGETNIDEVDVGIGNHGLPIGRDPGARGANLCVLQEIRIVLDQRHDAGRAMGRAEKMREGAVGHGVDLAHPARCSQYGDANLCQSFLLP